MIYHLQITGNPPWMNLDDIYIYIIVSLPKQSRASITGGKRIFLKHSRVVVQAMTLAAMALIHGRYPIGSMVLVYMLT